MSDEKQLPLEPKQTLTERVIGWWIEERRRHANTMDVAFQYMIENQKLKERIRELEQKNVRKE